MKKNVFYLIGFIVTISIDFIIDGNYNSALTEQLNEINLLGIIDNLLNPIGLFLILKFIYRSYWTAKKFAIFYGIIMLLESAVGYFRGKDFIEYNYVIGVLLGIAIVYLIEWVIIKIESDSHKKQLA